MDGVLPTTQPSFFDTSSNGQLEAAAAATAALGALTANLNPGSGAVGSGTTSAPNEKRRRLLHDSLPAAKRDRFIAGPLFFKLLVPNEVAGAVIGRAGETLDLLERTFGACLKIAPVGCYYPGGANERVLVIAGEQQAITQTLSEGVLQRLDEQSTPTGGRLCARVLAPRLVCGSIIGRGGQEIRQVCQATQAHINILPVTGQLPERIVQIEGTRQPVEQACNWLLVRLNAEENIEQVRAHLSVDYNDINSNETQIMSTPVGARPTPSGVADPAAALAAAYAKTQTPGMVNNGAVYQPSQPMADVVQHASAHGNVNRVTPYLSVSVAHPDALDVACSIWLQVTELEAGCILGKQGRQIQEITDFTHTRIQLSKREAGAAIDALRMVEIIGRAEDVHAAHLLLLKCMKRISPNPSVGADPTQLQSQPQPLVVGADPGGSRLTTAAVGAPPLAMTIKEQRMGATGGFVVATPPPAVSVVGRMPPVLPIPPVVPIPPAPPFVVPVGAATSASTSLADASCANIDYNN